MSDSVKNQPSAESRQAFQQMRDAEQVYFLMSGCTRAPYVYCCPETYDDAVFMFLKEEDAKAKATQLAQDKVPIGVAKMENRQLLIFFTSLFTMGVNALCLIQDGKETLIQLGEMVSRKTPEQLPDGKVWIENPQLHLTSLYYAQELRRPEDKRDTKQLAELQEEIMADFRKARFIVAVQKEGKGTPLIRMKDETTYLPAFTDILEFQKFNREDQFRPLVVEAEKIAKVLPEGAKGVVINPLGANLPLMIKKPQENQ